MFGKSNKMCLWILLFAIALTEEMAGADSRCGGVLEASAEDRTFSYKYEQPTDRYESCIWTVNAPNSTYIKLTDIRTRFRQPGNFNNYISVGHFNASNYDHLKDLQWNRLRFSDLPQALVVPGPVAFIHFVNVYANPGMGLRLTYAAWGPALQTTLKYDNYFLQGEYGTLSYPPQGGNYANDQRTTIVLKPDPSPGSTRPGHTFASTFWIVTKDVQGSAHCAADNVNVYAFGQSANAWYKNATLCGSPSRFGADIHYPRLDPVIITFKSNGSVVGEGFDLWWANSEFAYLKLKFLMSKEKQNK